MTLLLTVEEVAARMKLHPVSVRNLLRRGRLGAALKIGATWRLPEAELERALASFAVTPRTSRTARRAGLEPSQEAREALRPRRNGAQS